MFMEVKWPIRNISKGREIGPDEIQWKLGKPQAKQIRSS